MKIPDLTHRGMRLEPWPTMYDNNYRPSSNDALWCPELETADPEVRDEVILFKLQHILQWAWKRSSFYRKKWETAGVHPDIVRTLDDFSKFPVVTKQELRQSQTDNPPFGKYLCVDPDDIFHMHGTSGTTGDPTLFGISRDDWNRIAHAHARIMWAAGIRPSDTIFIGSPFSLYIGSWGALIGVERLGARILPFGAGIAGQTATAVYLMARVKPTCFYGTPSYALRVAEVAADEGLDPRRDFHFRIMFFSGEPGAGIPATKKKIEEIFGAHVIDMGSTAEMSPWMTNAECSARTGMHLWQDIVYTQVCDQKTYMPVPFGQEGTPIYTHLERTSQPMIRFLSGDLTRWDNAPCPCGRTYPRLPDGIYGRIDNMLIVRGHNVYPHVVEDTLRAIPGVGEEFRILIDRKGAMDEVVIQAEYHDSHSAPEARGALETFVTERLWQAMGVRPIVRLVLRGTLERTEFKAKRVIDNRELYQAYIRN